ncbi:unnamed protein product, partial [Musa textilis]
LKCHLNLIIFYNQNKQMLLSTFGSTYFDSLFLSILMRTCLLKKNHRYLCQFADDVPGTILGM